MRTNKRRFPDKTLNESKIYDIDWRPEIKTDSIASVAWSCNPSGLTFASSTITGTKTIISISGGSAGIEYAVTAQITKTTSGETPEAVLWLRVIPSDRVV